MVSRRERSVLIIVQLILLFQCLTLILEQEMVRLVIRGNEEMQKKPTKDQPSEFGLLNVTDDK